MNEIQGIDPTSAPADYEGLMIAAAADIFTFDQAQKEAKAEREQADADLRAATEPFEYAEALIRRDDYTTTADAAGRSLTTARNNYAVARRKART